jgi:hypothetical protein
VWFRIDYNARVPGTGRGHFASIFSSVCLVFSIASVMAQSRDQGVTGCRTINLPHSEFKRHL